MINILLELSVNGQNGRSKAMQPWFANLPEINSMKLFILLTALVRCWTKHSFCFSTQVDHLISSQDWCRSAELCPLVDCLLAVTATILCIHKTWSRISFLCE